MNPDFPMLDHVQHCSDVPEPVEGSHTVLHWLWNVGDIVEKYEYGRIRRLRVIEVGWNWLYPGAQYVTLSELHTPSRYVGCDPWLLRPLSTGLTEADKIAAAEMRARSASGSFHTLGAWRQQKDSSARQRWQSAKRQASATWTDSQALKTKPKAILALPAPDGWKPSEPTAEIINPPEAMPIPEQIEEFHLEFSND